MRGRIAGLPQRVAALAFALCAVGAASAAASDAPPWAHQLPNELMSPFCPGVTLAECPSPQAGSLKMWILVQAAAGRGEDELREELYARYGDQVRPTPEARGIGLAAYVIPVVVFLVGGGLVAAFLRRATRRAAPVAAADTAGLDPEVERRLDEVLSR